MELENSFNVNKLLKHKSLLNFYYIFLPLWLHKRGLGKGSTARRENDVEYLLRDVRKEKLFK